MTVIKAMYKFPTKAAKGVRVEEARIDATGLQGDRMTLVVGADGTQLTQRSEPRMVLISVELDDDGAMTFSAQGMRDLLVSADELHNGGDQTEVEVFRHHVLGYFPSTQIDEWFSVFLKREARFVKLRDDVVASELPDVYAKYLRDAKILRGVAPMSAADGTPLLIASRSSADLLAKVAGRNEIEDERIRANVVVDSFQGPFGEDFLTSFAIAAFTSDSISPCGRCNVPDVHPWSGTRSPDRFFHNAVKKLRHGRKTNFPKEKGNFFGVGCTVGDGVGSVIRVGDEVNATYSPLSMVDLDPECLQLMESYLERAQDLGLVMQPRYPKS